VNVSKCFVFYRAESSEVDNWSDKDRGRSTTLDTSDVNERLSVCLQLADARQPSDYRAKIV